MKFKLIHVDLLVECFFFFQVLFRFCIEVTILCYISCRDWFFLSHLPPLFLRVFLLKNNSELFRDIIKNLEELKTMTKSKKYETQQKSCVYVGTK